jgi:predicted RNA-binding Zn-ribbon protein involved in translation (DUF1610 family)
MCDSIIPSRSSSVQAPPLPHCPACGRATGYSSAARRVACPRCGWAALLTAAEARDFTNALIGLDADLNLDLFLQALPAASVESAVA